MFKVTHEHDHYHHWPEKPPRWLDQMIDRIVQELRSGKLSPEDQARVDEAYAKATAGKDKIDEALP